ncbi:MAG: hypothetical protein K0S55_62 [Clostridia bacterium]|nr:hypothetical protein [Clostridia bacterium]
MNQQKLLMLNAFINKSYESLSFTEFLKLTILNLHELVMYDSGMFFCGISKDCSYFKPYNGGIINEYYKKENALKSDYLKYNDLNETGKEAYVYKSDDYIKGIITISTEYRNDFLASQQDYHIVCLRIVYKGQFMGEIYLHRNKKNPDFDEEDIFILKLMQPHVSTVFNIIHTLNAVKYLETSDNRNNNVLGICIFDSNMSLTGGNVTGYDMLKIVSAYGSSILYHIKELCSDINLISNKTAFEFFKSSSLKIQKGELSILILVNNDKTTKNKIQYITILQYTDEAAAVLDYQFKFTKREADIIDNLIQGKNNSQISKALNMSENTVKTHIKNIYKKTGTSNRTELTYMLMVNP